MHIFKFEWQLFSQGVQRGFGKNESVFLVVILLVPQTVFFQKLFFLQKSSCLLNILLLEKYVTSALWELLDNQIIKLKIHFKAEMISQRTVLRYFLIAKMSFVINFPDHSQDRSRHQIKGFDMNSIGNRFFIQNNRSWYKVPMNFPVSDKENINLSQMLLDLVLRKSVANIDDMPVERRDMLGQRIMLVVLAKVSDQNFALIVGPS